MTSGKQQRDWIHVSDVVAGLVRLANVDLEPGLTLDIGGGRLASVRDVTELIYRLVGRGGGPRPGLLPDRLGDSEPQCADANRTRELLKWQAELSLHEGIKMMLNASRSPATVPLRE